MSREPVPPRPDPVDQPDHTLRVLAAVTFATNALLCALAIVGWLNMVWVVLVVIDVGLLLVWAGVGYVRLVAIGERIGRRMSKGNGGDPPAGT